MEARLWDWGENRLVFFPLPVSESLPGKKVLPTQGGNRIAYSASVCLTGTARVSRSPLAVTACVFRLLGPEI